MRSGLENYASPRFGLLVMFGDVKFELLIFKDNFLKYRLDKQQTTNCSCKSCLSSDFLSNVVGPQF